jgi:hypothetical protein
MMLNLTVKHVADDGHESVVPCAEVRHYPQQHKVVLSGTDDEVGSGEFIGGLVYVMNANGATVASYNLRHP